MTDWLCAHWVGGASTRATTNTAKPQSEHEATPNRHRERSERPVRGACEV